MPNPWTMAIINVLAELHREPDMKLNLKFEIEVLCKNLQIDINVSEHALSLLRILAVQCPIISAQLLLVCMIVELALVN